MTSCPGRSRSHKDRRSGIRRSRHPHARCHRAPSIRAEGSTSRELADIVEAEWTALEPNATIVRRHIGVDPIPADAWGNAVIGSWMPEEHRTPEQVAGLEFAKTLTDELEAADALLFALPLYNYGFSQHFKSWVDMIIADPRMAPGVPPITAGKPAVLVTVQGGNYGPGTPNEGWDHATPWTRHILEEVWQLDLEIVTRQFTLVGVNPALDRFTEMADELKAAATQHARKHGQGLSRKLTV